MEDRMIAIIGVTSALVSACMALASWWYNREVSRAALSLMDVKISGKRVKKDKLQLNFGFVLKNVGKETLTISESCLGLFSFKRGVFEQVKKTPMPNPIHSETLFTYSIPFTINIDPQIPDKEIADVLRTVRKHALILRLKYKGASLFSIEETTVKYFAGYEGRAGVYLLTQDEYREIEGHLPQEFKANQ